MGRKEDWRGRDGRRPSEREPGIGAETEAEREEEREMRVPEADRGREKGRMDRERTGEKEGVDSHNEELGEDRQRCGGQTWLKVAGFCTAL